jgi:hypothetical protein
MPTDALSRAVTRALEAAPCSVRALAKAADVPHSTLVRIQSGALRATPDVAHAVAVALKGWSRECDRLAQGIVRQSTRSRKGG